MKIIEKYTLAAADYRACFLPEQWMIAQPLLDLDHMRMEMDKVNIEAFIQKAPR